MGLFTNSAKYWKLEDGGIGIVAAQLRLYLYEDYLIWQNVLNGQSANIFYTDITSVSYSNGNFFANAFLQLGTYGAIYSVRLPCEMNGMDAIAREIENRRMKARRK